MSADNALDFCRFASVVRASMSEPVQSSIAPEEWVSILAEELRINTELIDELSNVWAKNGKAKPNRGTLVAACRLLQTDEQLPQVQACKGLAAGMESQVLTKVAILKRDAPELARRAAAEFKRVVE